MDSLSGNVAVITGAGTGIGKAAARQFAAAGAQTVLVGRRPGPLQETADAIAAAGGTAMVAPADLTMETEVERLIADIVGRFARIDVLVNNAGLNVPDRDLGTISAADWMAVVAANLTAPFLLTRAVLPAMRNAGAGTIINVSSMAGRRPSLLSGPAYGASKAGLNSFTESINAAERVHGIRACAICPGEVDTPILALRPFPPSEAARATMMQPEDVAAAILFVAMLPARAAIDLIDMRPTVLRDVSEDRRRAQETR